MPELESRSLSDPELATAVREGTLPTGVSLQDVAHELVRARHRLRQDSRTSEQIKKLRWTTEHTLTKIEELAQSSRVEQTTAEAIALWMEGYDGHPVDSALVAEAIREGRWR